MLTQIEIMILGRNECLTFEGKFPSKLDVLKYLKILEKENKDSSKVWQTYYKIIKSFKSKDWPHVKLTNKDVFVSSKGSVEFGINCTYIFQYLASGFSITWKILYPHKI